MKMIEVKNISVSYGKIPALNDVSVSLEKGKIVVLLGPNGAGKSTFIKSVIGLKSIHQGEIFHLGQRIDRLPVHQIASRGISLVPEGRRLFANMTVTENLFLGGYRRTRGEVMAEIQSTVRTYFPRLIERRSQVAGTLSGGEQQMVAVARALMSGADLILFDEPSLGLSPLMVKEVAQVILKVNREKGVSIIMVEQNARVGLQLADYVYLLDGGRVKMEGSKTELSKSEEIIRAYIGTAGATKNGERSAG
jgi:branched-chain amino acid transport system ATP-binding protein